MYNAFVLSYLIAMNRKIIIQIPSFQDATTVAYWLIVCFCFLICFFFSLCILLRWGAMDAEVYSEASKSIINILWEIGTSRRENYESPWVKAQAAAFESLSHYEVKYSLLHHHIANIFVSFMCFMGLILFLFSLDAIIF